MTLTTQRNGETLLLDVSRLLWRGWAGRLPTGIDRTCLAYAAHYRDTARAVVQYGGFTRIASPDFSRLLFDALLGGPAGLRARLLRLLPAALPELARRREVRGALYLNVGHTGLNTPGHSQWISRGGIRPVYFVHDLIPLTQPEYCRPGEAEKHAQRIRALLSSGVGVIGNSRDTLDTLAAYAASQRLPMPPSLVAPLGVERAMQAAPQRETPPLPVPYFVMLGTIEGRKNHLLMLTLWAELARAMGRATPRLVIIGQRGWECEQAVDMLERCDALRGHVIELGRCPDALLARYLRHARALLFPSFVEGYGLPLVEALCTGTPVIASDLAVFRELAGGIPDYLSPIDGLGWRDAVLDYAQEDSARRAAQCARLQGYAPPRWNEHFAQVDGWLPGLPTERQSNAAQPSRVATASPSI